MSDKLAKKRELLWEQMDGTQRLGYISFNITLWTLALLGGVFGFVAGLSDGGSMGSAFIIAIVAVGITMFAVAIYFIPYLLAYYRLHSSSTAIFVANLIFGATGLGWIICLIVSLMGAKTKIEVTSN